MKHLPTLADADIKTDDTRGYLGNLVSWSSISVTMMMVMVMMMVMMMIMMMAMMIMMMMR